MTVKELYESFNGNYQNALQTMMNDEFISGKILNASWFPNMKAGSSMNLPGKM